MCFISDTLLIILLITLLECVIGNLNKYKCLWALFTNYTWVSFCIQCKLCFLKSYVMFYIITSLFKIQRQSMNAEHGNRPSSIKTEEMTKR